MTHTQRDAGFLRLAGRFMGRNSLLPFLIKLFTKRQRMPSTADISPSHDYRTLIINALESLDLDANTTEWEAIESRYRQLAKQYHPDRYASQSLPPEMVRAAESRFQEIQEAYQLLKQARNL